MTNDPLPMKTYTSQPSHISLSKRRVGDATIHTSSTGSEDGSQTKEVADCENLNSSC